MLIRGPGDWWAELELLFEMRTWFCLHGSASKNSTGSVCHILYFTMGIARCTLVHVHESIVFNFSNLNPKHLHTQHWRTYWYREDLLCTLLFYQPSTRTSAIFNGPSTAKPSETTNLNWHNKFVWRNFKLSYNYTICWTSTSIITTLYTLHSLTHQ